MAFAGALAGQATLVAVAASPRTLIAAKWEDSAFTAAGAAALVAALSLGIGRSAAPARAAASADVWARRVSCRALPRSTTERGDDEQGHDAEGDEHDRHAVVAVHPPTARQRPLPAHPPHSELQVWPLGAASP